MTNLKIKTIQLEKVRFIPEHPEDGVLYYSAEYQTATHLCCCGCRERVITPIGLSDWSIVVDANENVTVNPSIGNWAQACQSHYWIRSGKIIPSYPMTNSEIKQMRAKDQKNRQRLLGKRSWWRRLLSWLFD